MTESTGNFKWYVLRAISGKENKVKEYIDAEIKKLQTNLISDEDYQKLQNQYENQFVNSNASIQGIAASLATNHVLKGDTNLINKEIDIYRSVTKEDLRNAAKKYLLW